MSDIILNRLKKAASAEYKNFYAKLVPNVDSDRILGVKAPIVKDIAKDIYNSANEKEFTRDLPHYFLEENNLHVFLINLEKDFDKCIGSVERFLPYIDNWSTCDSLRPKCFCKNKQKLLLYVKKWISSKAEYAVRFGVGVLMSYYLDDDFQVQFIGDVSKINDERYYVRMMIAWYFATALTKRYDDAIYIFENKVLPVWTHNKAIQKAIESYRIDDEKKDYLKGLKIKQK